MESGVDIERKVVLLNKLVGVGLIEKVTFEQRFSMEMKK